MNEDYYHEDCMYVRLDLDTMNYICKADPENGERDISVYGCNENCKFYCSEKNKIPQMKEHLKIKLKTKDDPVEHPRHYTNGNYECIDVIFDMLNGYSDPISAWLTGQIVKYIWRWPYKNGVEDLKKTRFYLDKLIDHEEKKDGE